MTRTVRLVSLIAVGVVLVGTLQAKPRHDRNVGGTLSDSPFDGAVTCSICTDCQTGGHATVEGSESEGLHEDPLNCESSSCADHGHGPCLAMLAPPVEGLPYGPGYYAALVEMVREAVRGDAAMELVGLLSEHGGLVKYVPERSAVQVLGCDGQVVVHLPIGAPLREASKLTALQ